MQVKLTVGRVPWREIQDMNQMGTYKRRCRMMPGLNELFPPPRPQEYCDIRTIVDRLQYYDTLSHQQIYQLMHMALQKAGLPEFPYNYEK